MKLSKHSIVSSISSRNISKLIALSLPNQRKIVNINLDDETPTHKSPHKKAKFSEENRANAFLDFMTQKRDNPATKVFIIIGTYPALRKALEDRGKDNS